MDDLGVKIPYTKISSLNNLKNKRRCITINHTRILKEVERQEFIIFSARESTTVY